MHEFVAASKDIVQAFHIAYLYLRAPTINTSCLAPDAYNGAGPKALMGLGDLVIYCVAPTCFTRESSTRGRGDSSTEHKVVASIAIEIVFICRLGGVEGSEELVKIAAGTAFGVFDI